MPNLNTYGIQDLSKINFKNINKIFNSRLITNSKYCELFEQKIKKITNSKFAVACNNGTSALMMCLLALRKNKKIVAIIPNINFVAIASIIELINGRSILVDVDEKTGMVSKEKFIEILSKCKKNKIKPNFFFPIHYAGQILDLNFYKKVCKKNNITIIEDGCHSFGSYNFINKKKNIVGDCKNSVCTTFSFHPVKNITTIEGGAITTNSSKLYNSLKLIRNHNLKRTNVNDPYKLLGPSLNFRMGEINAWLGIKQLETLSFFKKKRISFVKYFIKKTKHLKNDISILNDLSKNIFWHLLSIKIKKKSKKKLIKFLLKNKIGCQIHYKPLHKHKVFKNTLKMQSYKNSNSFYDSQLSLPLHSKLTKKDIDFIIKKLFIFFR